MPTGKVKWYNEKKGFGFICPYDGDKDIYVLHSGIVIKEYRNLKDDQTVTYDIVERDRGPQAINVKPC